MIPHIFFFLSGNTARELRSSPLQALTANFLCGKALILLSSLAVLRLFSWGVRPLRIARVFFMRRSRGVYFLLLYSFLRFSFCFWCMNVDARDGLPHDADFGELGGGAAGHLRDTQRGQLGLEVLELLR